MKTSYIQQEILLITGTSFAIRECCEKDTGKQNLTEREQLEEACWNGLLREMIPELYQVPGETKKLFLWDIKEGKSFIELELAEIPEKKDRYFSIDPYSFLDVQSLS